MLVSGKLGAETVKRTFFINDKKFDNAKDAFEAAGYEWLKK